MQLAANTESFALYVEIADRSARCLSDYLNPWYQYEKNQPKTELLRKQNAAWVGKFRPVNQVVYSSVAAKIGLLPADILFPVVQFYFRLDALRREIDSITTEGGQKPVARGRLAADQ
jgi:hypothetical protein